MISQFSFLLFTLAISFAQIVDEDPVFDWLQFSKGTENDYVDDLESLQDFNQPEDALDLQDRGLGDYGLKEPLMYNVTCVLQYNKVDWRPKDVPSPKYNITCASTDTNPLTHSRFHKNKSKFCIIKHQTVDKIGHLCKTSYKHIQKSKNTHHTIPFGIGCECHEYIEWVNPGEFQHSHH